VNKRFIYNRRRRGDGGRSGEIKDALPACSTPRWGIW